MESGPMSVDSSALDPPAVPEDGANEPKYGGYSRFELELEVRQSTHMRSPFGQATNLSAVCPVAREPAVSQLPRFPQVSHEPRLRRLPRLPAVLDAPALPQVPDVSHGDAQDARASAAREVPPGYHQPGPCDGSVFGGDEDGGGVASRGVRRHRVTKKLSSRGAPADSGQRIRSCRAKNLCSFRSGRADTPQHTNDQGPQPPTYQQHVALRAGSRDGSELGRQTLDRRYSVRCVARTSSPKHAI